MTTTPTGPAGPTVPAQVPVRRYSPLTSVPVVVGVLVLLTALVTAWLAAHLTSRARDYAPVSVSAEGTTALDLDGASGDVSVSCGGSTDFVMTQHRVRRPWHMERQGSVLRVWRESGGLFSVGWLGGGAEKVTLTVPEPLCHQSLDATLRIGSGNLRVSAGFKDVTADVGSGTLNLSGLADSVAADVGSGSVGMDIDGADRASVRVGSGELYAWFTQVPGTLSVDVGSGEARLSLPTGHYALTQDVGSGELDNRLADDAQGAAGRLDVSVGSGSVTLVNAASDG